MRLTKLNSIVPPLKMNEEAAVSTESAMDMLKENRDHKDLRTCISNHY